MDAITVKKKNTSLAYSWLQASKQKVNFKSKWELALGKDSLTPNGKKPLFYLTSALSAQDCKKPHTSYLHSGMPHLSDYTLGTHKPQMCAGDVVMT